MVKRFSTSVSKPETPIWRSIEYMDHEGMDLLRTPGSEGAVEKWEAYLATTKVSTCCPERDELMEEYDLWTKSYHRDAAVTHSYRQERWKG
jgi:hypothetical protein